MRIPLKNIFKEKCEPYLQALSKQPQINNYIWAGENKSKKVMKSVWLDPSKRLTDIYKPKESTNSIRKMEKGQFLKIKA